MSATISDLHTLLGRLRQAGLEVGVRETLRLHRVLELEPVRDLAGLERLLMGVVAKSTAEVEEVGQVLRRWRVDGEAWLEARQGIPPKPEGGSPRSRPRAVGSAGDGGVRRSGPGNLRRRLQGRHRWQVVALALVLAGLGGVVFWRLGPDGNGPNGDGGPGLELPPAESTYETQQVTFPELPSSDATSVASRPTVPLTLTLGAAFLLGAVLWQRYRGRSWLPPPEPLADRPGPYRVLLRPGDPADVPPFLVREEEEALVWGIERFVADEPGDRLDVSATVSATVRHAGRPVVVYERARHDREVWLWCDRSADDPALLRLAAELTAALEGSGLVVERADFWGVPQRLLAADGVEMAPNELDERRDAALVAVLTDGRLLCLALDSAESAPGTQALLRDLVRWPHLTFVEFSDGGPMASRGLPTVQPSETFAFLGGVTRPSPRRRESIGGDLLAWAAACALPSQGTDEATAHALRRRLKLEVSPWDLRRLGPRDGTGRLSWRRRTRVQLLTWLVEAEAGSGGGLVEESLLDCALGFWQERYDEEEERRRSAEGEVAWEGTPAQQRLCLDRALLRLWRQPVEAAQDLYGLYRVKGGGHGEVIRGALQGLVPSDRMSRLEAEARSELVPLPWPAGNLPPRVQLMFREMGLGGELDLDLARRLRRPGRLWLAVALCAGLAVAGGLGELARFAGGEPVPPEAPEPEAGSEWTNEKDGSVLVYVPSGGFLLGGDREFFSESFDRDDAESLASLAKPHTVKLTGFWIGKYPVTNQQYRRFLARKGGEPPPFWDDERFNSENQPVVGVSWEEAQTYCQENDMELPTEAQWEAAARGMDQRRYPWGNEPPDQERARYDQDWSEGRPSAVDAHPLGAGPYGTLDQAGNVLEWCLDAWSEDAYDGRDGRTNPALLPLPPEHSGAGRVLRGGAWVYPARYLVSAFRVRSRPSSRNLDVGFRCVLSFPAEP